MAWNIRTSRTTQPDLEILVNQVNVDVAPSIVLDASAVAPDGNGERKLVAGTPLTKVGSQYVKWDPNGGGAGVANGAILGILNRTERFPDGTSKSDLPSAMWNHGQWFRADRIIGWATNQAAIKAALPTCKFS